MADFSGLAVVTNAGIAAEAAAAANGWALQFTKVTVGRGIIAVQDPRLFTDLLTYVMDANLIGINNLVPYQCTVRFQVSSADVVSTFVLSEVGLWASLNGGAAFLYCYISAGATGDTLVPTTTGAPFIDQYTIAIPYSNAPIISATLAVYPTVNLHAATHLEDDVDPIPLTTVPKSGLMYRLSGIATDVFHGDGSWSGGFMPGMSMSYRGSTAPAGWVLEDGAPYVRLGVMADLFAVIGTTYGAGNGTTTFNVPDSRSRVDVGSNASSVGAPTLGAGLTARILGAKAGEENHILSTAEIPSHNHTATQAAHAHTAYDTGHSHTATEAGHTHSATDSGHTHAYIYGNLTSTGVGNMNNAPYPYNNFAGNTGVGCANITIGYTAAAVTVNAAAAAIVVNPSTPAITVANSGGGAGHNNMQPYLVATKIIKY